MNSVSQCTVARIILCLITVVLPTSLSAQRVTDLVQGTRVRVEDRHTGVTDGIFRSVSADTLTLVENGVIRSFLLNDTETISQFIGHDQNRGVVRTGALAAIIGSLAGAAIGAYTFKPCESKGVYDCGFVPNTRSRATTFGAVVFGATSLIVGSFVGAARSADVWKPVSRR